MILNVPKACELATAAMIRTHARVGEKCVIRCWQSLRSDPEWNEEKDKTLPLVDVRYGPETVDEDQVTMVCTGAITPMTKADDDRDHAAISEMYGEIHAVLRSIFSAFMDGGFESGRYADFVALLATETESGIHVGGVTFAEPMAPSDDDGANTLGIGFQVHFSYV